MKIKQQVKTVKYEVYSKYKTDPIADTNPMLSDIEHELIKKDIEENGQLHPIVIFDNKIVDGRNRYKVIKELKKDLKVIIAPTRDDAIKLATSYNDKRRHMSKGQYAVRAAYTILKSRKDDNDTIAVDNVFEVENDVISKRTVEDAIRLITNNDDLAQDVFNGEMKFQDAMRSLTAKETKAKGKTEDDTTKYLKETYTEDAVTKYKQYIKRGKYTKESLAKELVELHIKLEKLETK